MTNGIFGLHGKKVLITGASSGLGKAIAIECAKQGAEVILVGRDIDRLNATLSLCEGSNNWTIQQDLTDLNGLSQFVQNLPMLDGAVFCAGIIKRNPIKFINPSTLQNIFDINVFSIVELTRLLVKLKKINNDASLVMISSVGSDHASLGNISYMASKGAINSFIRGLAFELAKNQVRVNAVLPGMIKTNLTKGISDEDLKFEIERYPLGRFGQPEEVAYACIYLLSDASKWVTGTKLVIDGGLTLR